MSGKKNSVAAVNIILFLIPIPLTFHPSLLTLYLLLLRIRLQNAPNDGDHILWSHIGPINFNISI